MREVLLHGGSDDAFDRSAPFARRLAESFGARLHVLYTVNDPLNAGWTSEMGAELMPDLHQAVEAEARERLAKYIPAEEQERLGVQIAIQAGSADEEMVRYIDTHHIDLAIVQALPDDDDAMRLAQGILERGRCALLVLR